MFTLAFKMCKNSKLLLKNDEKEFGKWCADQIEQTIILEGPDSVAAVFLEPVQNSGGCFPPPPGYLERVREICTKYDILFVADETITAFGRIGETLIFLCFFIFIVDLVILSIFS